LERAPEILFSKSRQRRPAIFHDTYSNEGIARLSAAQNALLKNPSLLTGICIVISPPMPALPRCVFAVLFPKIAHFWQRLSPSVFCLPLFKFFACGSPLCASVVLFPRIAHSWQNFPPLCFLCLLLFNSFGCGSPRCDFAPLRLCVEFRGSSPLVGLLPRNAPLC
jgi:hypothetical protein